MSSDELVSSIKTDVVKLLEEKLQSHDITPERAREISRFILNELDPHLSEQQIYEVVEHFDEHFAELLPVVVKFSQGYEDELHQLINTRVHELLQEGKISDATNMMKNFELGKGDSNRDYGK